MNVFSEARWIQDPRFNGLKPLNILFDITSGKDEAAQVERLFQEHASGNMMDIHMLIRKSFALPENICKASIMISADDYYKLYINGQYSGEGPAASYTDHYYYNRYDIAAHLRHGQNVIAVHCYYQGLISRVWQSLDQRMGMIAAADIVLASGCNIIVQSDAEWKYKIAHSRSVTFADWRSYYQGPQLNDITGSNTGFRENWDYRISEQGWRDFGFDDSSWSKVSAHEICTKDYNFIEQPTPPPQRYKVSPVLIKPFEKGHTLIDFGKEITGSLALRLTGSSGHKVRIIHGEELGDDGSVMNPARGNAFRYDENWILSGRTGEVLEFFDYKGFRFAEVLHAPEALNSNNTWADIQHYPFPENACRFESSSPVLNKIWEICRQAVINNCQDKYVDCPQREKGQYLGDNIVIAPAQLFLTGDSRLMRKSLFDAARSARISPSIMATSPGGRMQKYTEFSLLFAMEIEVYYRLTGDLAAVRELLPVADQMLAYFARFEDASGLIGPVDNSCFRFIDHKGLTDHYPAEFHQPDCLLNAFYYGAMQSVSRLHVALNQVPADHKSFKTAFIQTFYHNANHYFIDTADSSNASLHSNFLSLLFGLTPVCEQTSVVNYLKNRTSNGASGLPCSPYMAYFFLKSLFEQGESDLAYTLMTADGDYSWKTMVENGATSATETFKFSQKRNMSWCHAWSSAPIPMVVEYMMGLWPASPGWTAVDFHPMPPSQLDWAKLTLPLPQGPASVSFEKKRGKIIVDLSLPPGIVINDPADDHRRILKSDTKNGIYQFIY